MGPWRCGTPAATASGGSQVERSPGISFVTVRPGRRNLGSVLCHQSRADRATAGAALLHIHLTREQPGSACLDGLDVGGGVRPAIRT